MAHKISLIADHIPFDPRWQTSTPRCNISFFPILLQRFIQIHTDPANTAHTTNGIYLDYFHKKLPFFLLFCYTKYDHV